MVFLTFLGMFTNQYVPVWMKDNENKHMNEVIGQLSSLKSGVDMQIMASNQMVASAPIYAPIQLQADGVPVFASPTMGQLSFSGAKAYNTVGAGASLNYTYSNGKLNAMSGAWTGGSLMFYGPNRYFVQQAVIYENGAIILNQSDGEVVLAGISIKITPSGSNNMVLITFISMLGDDKTIGGFGTKSVTTAVDYSSYTQVGKTAPPNNLTLRIVSEHTVAWNKYFKTVLGNSGVTSSWWVNSSKYPVFPGTAYYSVTVDLNSVTSLEFTKAVASVTLAEIGV